METTLEDLKQHSDTQTLKLALMRLCSRFGRVAKLDVLTASKAGKRQALCFLRMDSDEEERTLMAGLGVGRFSGELVMVVDLNSRFHNEPMTA